MINLSLPEYELLNLAGNVIVQKDYGDGEPYSDASIVFLKRKDEIKFPFTYENYVNNKDIIGTLKGYGIDVEQFWYVILFIYDFTQEKCVNVLTLGETTKIQTKNLTDFLSGIDSFTITADDKKKLVIDDIMLIDDLKNHLETLLIERSDDLDGHTFKYKLVESSKDLYSPSVQMWFAATLCIKVFAAMKLPSKRAKDIPMEYIEKNGEQVPVRNSIQTVYFNKMLLISQLMYLMIFTRNKSFLISENSLKGILKQYKNFELTTFSKFYCA